MVQSLEKLVLGAVTLVSLSGCGEYPSVDTGSEAYVVLYPGSPSIEDDLHCRVDRSEDYTFDFYWLVNRALVQTETGFAGSLGSVFFQSKDYVECSAWVPESAWYDSFEIGTSGVYIE